MNMSKPEITREALAKMIDHSLLKPTMTRADTIAGLEIALEYNVAAATIKPCYTRLASETLQGSDVMVNPVICFPFGYDTTESKVAATRQAIDEGAQEIDMVMNLGAFFGGEYDYVRDDIAAVVEAAQDAPVKVIFETGYFTDDAQVIKACRLSEEAGVAFIKTSSGFAPSPYTRNGEVVGYTLHQLELMRASVGEKVQVKAAQGVRSLGDVLEARALGVTRCGASRTVKIIKEWEAAYG
jgi:deoxyribose-phosphate aldolase